jgi:hypothetical protein
MPAHGKSPATARMISLGFHPMEEAIVMSHGHVIRQGGDPFDVKFTANENQPKEKYSHEKQNQIHA